MPNGNDRGSTADRRARKYFLLDTFGDGIRCQCSTCPAMLSYANLTVDRWPVMGCDGGTYRRNNIRPQCSDCANKQGGLVGSQRRKKQRVKVAV